MKHEIKHYWTGAWNKGFVVKCSCGFNAEGIQFRRDVEEIEAIHLTSPAVPDGMEPGLNAKKGVK